MKVEQRFLEQWFFAITRYAERLLGNLDRLDWPESTIAMQRNWIGRSEGAELVFETPAGQKITVFTTRPDTVFGATYLVLAPEHPLVDALTAVEQQPAVRAYQREVAAKDIVSRKVGDKTKTGVFLGSYARNPATGEAIPIWIADYVLMEYGTGAIMAVPAHDGRDFEFATQFRLPIVQVVRRDGEALPSNRWTAFSQLPGRSTGSPPPRAGSGSSRGSRGWGWARRACSTGCTTGASRGNATGGRRSRSSTASGAGPSGCRSGISRSSSP